MTDDIEYSEIERALASIGLSTALLLGASILSNVIGFVTRIVMTRYLAVTDYGNVVLGITLITVLGLLSFVGMDDGFARYLPRTKNKDEESNVVGSVFQTVLIISILLGVAAFIGAEFISHQIFDEPGLTPIIRVFSVTLPFYSIYQLSLRGIQGYEKTIPRIKIKDVVLPVSRLGLVALFVLVGYGALGIAAGYALAFVVSGLVGLYIFFRIGSSKWVDIFKPRFGGKREEILRYSVPLAVTGGVGIIAKQADFILLGILRQSAEVGIYDITFLLSQYILFFSPAIAYLFFPIVSRFDRDEDTANIDRLYTITTRWLIVSTFPVFALLFLFPGQTLGFFFGSEYRRGGLALAVLVLGFYVSQFPGFIGSLLKARGETKAVMNISLITEVSNVLLNIVLISLYGIVGAALGTAFSRVLNNVLQVGYVYRKTGMHPFKRPLLTPSLITWGVFLGYYLVSWHLGLRFSFLQGFAVATLISLSYLVAILITNSVYQSEIKMIKALLRRVGLPTKLADPLERFTYD